MSKLKALQLPVTYSLLSSKGLEQYLLPLYGLSTCSVKFIYQGFHDTYLIYDGNFKAILRIYRANWKSEEAVNGELELLMLLKEKGISVSYPIKNKLDSFVQKINCPEGERYAVLFSYAEGNKLISLSENDSITFGSLIGKIHLVTIGKSIKSLKRDYFVQDIIQTTLDSISTVFPTNSDPLKIFLKVSEMLHEKFKYELGVLKTGICHGDPHYQNIFIERNTNKPTIFDFDFAGNGFLLYDIGSFCHYERNNERNIKGFLEGYNSVNNLSEKELRMIPFFKLLMKTYHLGARTKHADGIKTPFWFPEEIINKIKEIESEIKNHQQSEIF